MATQYFRITGYHPGEDFCFIMDSHGMFEKLWQFSSFLVKKGLKVLEVSSDEQFKDINIDKAGYDNGKILLRATGEGKPIYTDKIINGTTQRVVTVGEKSYIPNFNQ